jgi:hypothetical protein
MNVVMDAVRYMMRDDRPLQKADSPKPADPPRAE